MFGYVFRYFKASLISCRENFFIIFFFLILLNICRYKITVYFSSRKSNCTSTDELFKVNYSRWHGKVLDTAYEKNSYRWRGVPQIYGSTYSGLLGATHNTHAKCFLT